MHTAICTFDDPAQAEQAVNRLLQSGFDRHAVHMEHRHADGSPMDDSHAHRDRDVKGKFSFFERLFGAGREVPHVDAYTSAVERGLYVVIVEGRDEAEAGRAQEVLHGMEASDLNLLHRAGKPPLRDVVAERQALADSQRSAETARADLASGDTQRREREASGEQRPIASPELPTDSDKPSDKPR